MPRYIGHTLTGTANSSVTSPAPGSGNSVKKTFNSGVFSITGGSHNSVPVRRNGTDWLQRVPPSVSALIHDASNNYIHVTRGNPNNPNSSGNPAHPATTPHPEIHPGFGPTAAKKLAQGVQSTSKTFPAATKFVVVKLYGGQPSGASNGFRQEGGYTEIRMGPKAGGNTFWFTTNGFHPGADNAPTTYGTQYNVPGPLAWVSGYFGHPYGGGFASISSERFDQPSAPTPAPTKQGQTIALAAGAGGTHHQAGSHGGAGGYAATPSTAGGNGAAHGGGPGGNGATLSAGGSGNPGGDGFAMAGRIGTNSPDGRGGGGGNGYWGGEAGVGSGGSGNRGGGGGGGSNYYALPPSPFAPLFLNAAGGAIANSVYSHPSGYKPGATDPGRPTKDGGAQPSPSPDPNADVLSVPASTLVEEQYRKGYVIVHAFSEDISATYSDDERLNLFYQGVPNYRTG